jgi:hypothetical protein
MELRRVTVIWHGKLGGKDLEESRGESVVANPV